MNLRLISGMLSLALLLPACTEIKNIEYEHSARLNQKLCRINHIPMEGVENLHSHNSIGIMKYNNGTIWMWIRFFEKERVKKYIKVNPQVIFKLFKNNMEQGELTFTKTFDHSALIAFFKIHKKDSKVDFTDNYNPPFPTEDIWPALKHEASFLYIGGLKAVSFAISEEDLNKILTSEGVKVLVQTEGKPLMGKIPKDAILLVKEFKNICWSNNPQAILSTKK